MSDPARDREQSRRATELLDGDRDPEQVLAEVERLADVGIWWYDKPGEQIRWSDRAKRLHGIATDARPTVKDVVELYAAEDQQRLNALFEAAIEEGEPFEITASFVGNRTTERAMRLRCEPDVDGDSVEMVCGTVRDVTDARRREQRIRILRETSKELKHVHSREEVAEVVADAAANILGLVNTAVRLVDERNRLLETIVVTEECIERAGERPDYPVDGNSAAAEIFRSGEPERFADMRPVDDWDRGELVSGLYVPIGEHGVLSAGDIVTDAFDENDLEAAALLGEVAAETLTRIDWARRSRAI